MNVETYPYLQQPVLTDIFATPDNSYMITCKAQDPVMLWFTHLGVYHEINKNPRAWAALHTRPGYRWMKRANWIAAIIFFLIIWIF